MKWRYACFLVLVLTMEITIARGQTTQPPSAVKATFANMFPDARNAGWNEKVNNFTVFFTVKNRKCEAKFAKNGSWMSTEEAFPLDSLPQQIGNALKQSKYADWQLSSSYSLNTPGTATQYHLVITKNDIGRKILFFSSDGKLLADH